MATVSSLTYDDLGSAAQRDRRRRILDATVALASKGGFDAVQMRAVAEQADVALGTLYRYFPSKIHLLVSALARQFEETEANLGRRAIPGDDPADRVTYVLTRATRGMQREPNLTEALTRAFMFADSTVAGEIHVVGLKLTAMLNRAMQGDAVRRGRRAHRPRDRRRPRDQRRLARRPRLLGHRPHHRRGGLRAPRDRRRAHPPLTPTRPADAHPPPTRRICTLQARRDVASELRLTADRRTAVAILVETSQTETPTDAASRRIERTVPFTRDRPRSSALFRCDGSATPRLSDATGRRAWSFQMRRVGGVRSCRCDGSARV